MSSIELNPSRRDKETLTNVVEDLELLLSNVPDVVSLTSVSGKRIPGSYLRIWFSFRASVGVDVADIKFFQDDKEDWEEISDTDWFLRFRLTEKGKKMKIEVRYSFATHTFWANANGITA